MTVKEEGEQLNKDHAFYYPLQLRFSTKPDGKATSLADTKATKKPHLPKANMTQKRVNEEEIRGKDLQPNLQPHVN